MASLAGAKDPLTPTLSPGEGAGCGLIHRAEDNSGVPSPLREKDRMRGKPHALRVGLDFRPQITLAFASCAGLEGQGAPERAVAGMREKLEQIGGRDGGCRGVDQRMRADGFRFPQPLVEHNLHPALAVVEGGEGRDAAGQNLQRRP